MIVPNIAQNGLSGLPRKTLWRRNKQAVQAKDYKSAVEIWKAVSEPREQPLDADEGRVTTFTARRIAGWLPHRHSGKNVHLCLNDRPLYTSPACQIIEIDGVVHKTGFKFTLSKLWRYVGRGDYISLVVDGEATPLYIESAGRRLQPWLKRRSRSEKLFRKMESGYVFNKWGKLQLPLDRNIEYTQTIFDLFDEVSEHLRDKFGVSLFIIYGTLLGCIRSGDFIAHDDDIDVVYVSRFTDPKDVRREFVTIALALMDKGYDVSPKPIGAKVRRPGAKYKHSFGMHYAWISKDGGLDIAYGYHGPRYFPGGEIRFRPAMLAGRQVMVPEESEKLLEMLYSSGWKVPDPGFSHHSRSRVNTPSYHLSQDEIEVIRQRRLEL